MHRVLLVEDNELNRTIIEDAFEFDSIPAELACAENGCQAIELAQSLKPALILMDVQLPDLSGLEVARRLQQITTTRNIPVWVVSAHALKGDEELAFEAGCVEYFTKPLDVASLGEKLKAFLNQLSQSDSNHV
ncbi:response regulator [Lignipirellula cremea]|uniref:Polar-differentiation response regulator DivK n=1 Tax=Lignipirellula cremea TaxID=2528010 RepID=A0A518DVL9_9BACT|nr:response regulator [Lignipirellula cremea]QDU95874.1 Polar-differentiation response regulator DivK [Lignipirellula cremea]